MKKICVFLAVIVLLAMTASFFVAADSTFFDEFDQSESSEYITYQGLSVKSPDFGEEIGWPDAPDPTVLTANFTGGTPSVLYHISGVDRLTVSCYLPMSPLAHKSWTGDYTLMDIASDPKGNIDLDGTLPVSYSPVDGNLYLNTPDQGFLLYMVEEGMGVFRPLPDEDAFLSQIKESLTTSFVEVLVSSDGESFHPLDYDISACRMSLEASSPLSYFYTTLYLPIPSGTRYIGVQLSFPDQIPVSGGGTLQNPNSDKMRLARVDFQGEYLNWGDPLPDEEEELDPIYNFEGIYFLYRRTITTRNTGDNITQYFEITNNYYNGSGSDGVSDGGAKSPAGKSEEKMKLILSDEASVPAAGGQSEQKTSNILLIISGLVYLLLAGAVVVVLIFKFRSYR